MGFIMPLPSDWANFINTVIFEFLLLTFIFHLTSDVCARLNHLVLVDGSVRDLVVVSPPLIGGGLISTNRKRSMFMLALRGLSIFLIFGSALTIDGESETKKVFSTKLVRTTADVPVNTTAKLIDDLVDLRMTCTTTENDSMVFGRLDNDGYCETNLLLLERAIRIKNEATPTDINLSFPSGCHHNETVLEEFQDGRKYSRVTYSCKEDVQKASIFCTRMAIKNDDKAYHLCMGSFKLSESKWALCEYADDKHPHLSISIKGLCHAAENLDDEQDRWPKISIPLLSPLSPRIPDNFTIIDLIGAVSVIGVKSRVIPSFERRDSTNIDEIWFLCLTIKLILVVSLASSSIWLRRKGAKPVLKNDQALIELLRQNLNDSFGARSGDQRQTIYLHLRTTGDGTRNVWASSVPNYSGRSFNAGEET